MIINIAHLMKLGWHLALSGIASWYGPCCYGNPTSSGARFTPTTAYCASPTFYGGMKPYEIIVVYKGRAATCLVNDHCPGCITYGRILDLGYAVKQELGVPDLSEVQIWRK